MICRVLFFSVDVTWVFQTIELANIIIYLSHLKFAKFYLVCSIRQIFFNFN
jgi:hypothetical protein